MTIRYPAGLRLDTARRIDIESLCRRAILRRHGVDPDRYHDGVTTRSEWHGHELDVAVLRGELFTGHTMSWTPWARWRCRAGSDDTAEIQVGRYQRWSCRRIP